MTKAKNEVILYKKTNEAITKLAEKKGITRAATLNTLLENVGVGNDNVKPVVLQIPVELVKDNKVALETWLTHRTAGITKLFYPE